MYRRALVPGTVFACILALLLTLPAGKVRAEEPEITLKFANYLPPPTVYSKLCEEFIADLEARTHGRVKVRYFPGGSLLKAPAMLKGIESGIADIGLSHTAYTPGRMPVMEVFELPLGIPTGWVANHVVNDFYRQYRPKEMDEIKVMWMHANSPAVLVSKDPLRTLEDFKGKSIRAPGRMGEIVSALGAAPAPTPLVETFDALSKGVIQGVFVGADVIRAFRLAEAAKYVTVATEVGSSYPFYVAISKQAYAGLPADIKEIFDTLCGVYEERFALMWNASHFGGLRYAAEKGMEVTVPSAEERTRWGQAVAAVIENYVKAMVEKGYPEAEVRSWIQYLRERTDYWTQRQGELAVTNEVGPGSM